MNIPTVTIELNELELERLNAVVNAFEPITWREAMRKVPARVGGIATPSSVSTKVTLARKEMKALKDAEAKAKAGAALRAKIDEAYRLVASLEAELWRLG